MEEQTKIKKNIYRFFHMDSGAKLNIWAASDEEAMTTFSTIVSSVLEWKLRKAAPSSKRNKKPHSKPMPHGSLVH